MTNRPRNDEGTGLTPPGDELVFFAQAIERRLSLGPVEGTARFHYAWHVLAVGTLVVFGALGLARFGYTMLLPPMQAALGLDNTQAGALATANLAGYFVTTVAGGALASHLGPRVVIAAGLAVAALGMLLTGLADSFGEALAWRALTGVGSGASNVPAMGLLAAWFARRRRGLAAGIGVTGSSLALIVLGPLVPLLLATFGANGWRLSWFVFAGATFVVAILALVVLRDRPADLGLHPLGATADEVSVDAPAGGPHWGRVYRSGAIWHLGLVYVAFGFSYIIYMTFFTKYLVAEAHYTPAAAGGLFMTMGWFSLLCGLVWGRVSDSERVGRRGALLIVYLIQTVAFALFALWPAPVGLTLSAALFGLTAWSIPAIVAAMCGDLLGPRLAPAGLGFVTLFFGIGQAVAPSAAGAVADAAGSLAPAMLLAAGVAFVGALGSLGLGRPGVRTTRTASPD
jgi:sugar phosphate permease